MQARVKNRCGEITSRAAAIVIVVHRHDLAIGPYDRPNIAYIPAAGIVAKCDRLAPGFPGVTTHAGIDSEWLSASAIDQAQAFVGKPEQTGRISFAGIRLGDSEKVPTCAVVRRAVSVDPAPGWF